MREEEEQLGLRILVRSDEWRGKRKKDLLT
jgi:hypothetical protein